MRWDFSFDFTPSLPRPLQKQKKVWLKKNYVILLEALERMLLVKGSDGG